MTIELGGNIVLAGFERKDFTELIVVKKMVGQYVRNLTDTSGAIESLHLTLEEDDVVALVRAQLRIAGKERTATGRSHNLYVALDTCLKELTKAN